MISAALHLRTRWPSLLWASGLWGCIDPSTADPLSGDWVVVSHAAPGVSALTPQEAEAWIGTPARFSADRAVFGDNVCEVPEYHEETLDERGLLEGFRISKADLGITADAILTVDIRCEGRGWGAPGSFILVDGDRLFTHWDGVFFELRQNSAVR